MSRGGQKLGEPGVWWQVAQLVQDQAVARRVCDELLSFTLPKAQVEALRALSDYEREDWDERALRAHEQLLGLLQGRGARVGGALLPLDEELRDILRDWIPFEMSAELYQLDDPPRRMVCSIQDSGLEIGGVLTREESSPPSTPGWATSSPGCRCQAGAPRALNAPERRGRGRSPNLAAAR